MLDQISNKVGEFSEKVGEPRVIQTMIDEGIKMSKTQKIKNAITKPRVKGFRTIGVGFGISYLGYLQMNPDLMSDIGLTPFWTGTIQIVLGSLVIPVLRKFTNTDMGSKQ